MDQKFEFKAAATYDTQEFHAEPLPDFNILADDDTEHDGLLAPCSVFISYEQSEKQFVHLLYQALNAGRPRNMWVDWDNVKPDDAWTDQIRQGIENCDVFVMVITAKALQDFTWNLALTHAFNYGKRMIVVTPDPDFDLKSVQKTKDRKFDKLGDLKWVWFDRTGAGYAKQIQVLTAYIDEDQRHAQYHTKILRRAINWERYDFEKSLLFRKSDLVRAQHWLSASALGSQPKPTTLHLSFLTASASLDASMKKRRLIAVFFGVIVTIGIAWPSWGVFFFSLIFSHFFVYFSSHT